MFKNKPKKYTSFEKQIANLNDISLETVRAQVTLGIIPSSEKCMEYGAKIKDISVYRSDDIKKAIDFWECSGAPHEYNREELFDKTNSINYESREGGVLKRSLPLKLEKTDRTVDGVILPENVAKKIEERKRAALEKKADRPLENTRNTGH